MINVLLVDDEAKARQGLTILLKEDPEIRIVGEARNGVEAIELVEGHQPDLMFLDIQMPKVNGFEVLESLDAQKWPFIIFTTAYDQYALKAFEVHAIDYLLKPYGEDRFKESLANAKRMIRQKSVLGVERRLKKLLNEYERLSGQDEVIQLPKTTNDQLVIKSSGKIYFLKLHEIYMLEALDSYVKVHTANRFYVVKGPLKSIEANHPKVFTRIHRSFLVNLEKVRFMEPYFKGDFYLILDNDVRVRGSRNYRGNLPEML